MKRWQVRAIYSLHGKVKYTLIDTYKGLQPVMVCIWANHLSRILRPNSVRDYLRDLSIFLEWTDSNGILITERFANLEGFSLAEINSFTDKLASRGDGKPVSANTFNRRIAAISEFIEFQMERYLDRCLSSYNKSILATRKIKRIIKAFSQLRKGHAEVSLDENPVRPLTDIEIDRLLVIAHPNSDYNPFRSDYIRIRNYCMMLLSIECLLRRSELVLLELNDVELYSNPTIRIKKPSEVISKQLKDGAAIKTRGRLIPISNNLADWIATYVNDHRFKLKKEGVITSSLFLSEKTGLRIASSTANAYLKKLAFTYKIVFEETIFLHAHMLRVTGATHLKKAADNNISSNSVFSKHMEIQELMTYVGGWCPSSEMPRHYSREAIAEKFRELKNAK